MICSPFVLYTWWLWDIVLCCTNSFFALLNTHSKKPTKRHIRHDKSSSFPPNAADPSGAHSRLKQTEDAHDICHSLWSMIWLQRSYILDDLQSILRAKATDRQRVTQRRGGGERAREAALWTIHQAFSFKKKQTHDVYHKKWIFQSITWASNWLKTRAEMQVVLHTSTVNKSRKKVFSFSQSLTGVSEHF